RDLIVTGVQTCALPIFWDAYFGVVRERAYRNQYNEHNCDEVPWTPGGNTADHPGHVSQLDNELVNILNEIRRRKWHDRASDKNRSEERRVGKERRIR